MRIQPSRVAKAIGLALAGGAVFFAGVSTAHATATTMYNTFTTTDQTKTDGWVYGFCPTCTNTTRAIAYNSANPQAYTGGGAAGGGFYGTDPNNPTAYTSILPFGYGGTSHLNWAIHLTTGGDTAEISQADALARYGYAAEIDTGGGAWRDNGSTTGGIQTGWKHQTDVGLIVSDVDQTITLNLTNLNSSFSSRFGITVFEGMDSKTAAYVHHGSWNNPTPIPAAPGGTPPAQAAHPYTMSNPWGTVGVTFLKYSDLVDNTALNAFSFSAKAGQVYTVYLGGVDFGDWNDNLAAYSLNLTSVPAPTTLWLLGSGVVGWLASKRKSAKA